MRGVYTATYKISTLTAAKTLMYLTAPASVTVEIISAEITNPSNETNEQLEAYLKRIGTLGTPTATSVTPAKDEPGDQAAGSVVKANVTASEPSYTANTEIGWAGFSSLVGYAYEPAASVRPTVSDGASIGLYLVSTPASSPFDVIVRLRFREIG